MNILASLGQFLLIDALRWSMRLRSGRTENWTTAGQDEACSGSWIEDGALDPATGPVSRSPNREIRQERPGSQSPGLVGVSMQGQVQSCSHDVAQHRDGPAPPLALSEAGTRRVSFHGAPLGHFRCFRLAGAGKIFDVSSL